jgi:hypothetical protein
VMVQRHTLHMLFVFLGFVWNLLLNFVSDFVKNLLLLVVLFVYNRKAFAFVFQRSSVVVRLSLKTLDFCFIEASCLSLGMRSVHFN